MFDFLWSFLGRQQPPSVTITGLRMPADGTPPHLLSLTTTSNDVPDNVDCFLFHVPDLRQYWNTKYGWKYRDLERFHIENQSSSSCNGLYYVFYSFDTDHLPENKFVPAWVGGSPRHCWYGDVFVVKMDPHETDEYGWAAYEDVAPEFLDMLAQGPVKNRFQT